MKKEKEMSDTIMWIITIFIGIVGAICVATVATFVIEKIIDWTTCEPCETETLLSDTPNMFSDEEWARECNVIWREGCPLYTGEIPQGTPYGVNSIKDFEILFTLKSEVGNGGKVEATFTPEFDCQKDSMDLIEQSIEENLLFKNPK